MRRTNPIDDRIGKLERRWRATGDERDARRLVTALHQAGRRADATAVMREFSADPLPVATLADILLAPYFVRLRGYWGSEPAKPRGLWGVFEVAHSFSPSVFDELVFRSIRLVGEIESDDSPDVEDHELEEWIGRGEFTDEDAWVEAIKDGRTLVKVPDGMGYWSGRELYRVYQVEE